MSQLYRIHLGNSCMDYLPHSSNGRASLSIICRNTRASENLLLYVQKSITIHGNHGLHLGRSICCTFTLSTTRDSSETKKMFYMRGSFQTYYSFHLPSNFFNRRRCSSLIQRQCQAESIVSQRKNCFPTSTECKILTRELIEVAFCDCLFYLHCKNSSSL